MSKTFTEVFTEIKEGLSISAKGKPVKTFSRSDFDKLAKAFLNDVNYSTEVYSTRNGEVQTKTVNPVQGFRGMIQAILRDFGVDKAEAERVMDSTYEIKNVNGLYEFVSELIYVYMDAGKKFEFMSKEDFIGNISLDEVEETEKDYIIKKKDGSVNSYKVAKQKHKVLNKKSKCPQWKKSKK